MLTALGFVVLLEGSGGEVLLQTEYLCAKAVFILLGTFAKLSKAQLGLVHPVCTRNRFAFLLQPSQGCSRELWKDENTGGGCE